MLVSSQETTIFFLALVSDTDRLLRCAASVAPVDQGAWARRSCRTLAPLRNAPISENRRAPTGR